MVVIVIMPFVAVVVPFMVMDRVCGLFCSYRCGFGSFLFA